MSNPPTMAITGTSSRSRTLLTHLACAELRRSRIHVISLSSTRMASPVTHQARAGTTQPLSPDGEPPRPAPVSRLSAASGVSAPGPRGRPDQTERPHPRRAGTPDQSSCRRGHADAPRTKVRLAALVPPPGRPHRSPRTERLAKQAATPPPPPHCRPRPPPRPPRPVPPHRKARETGRYPPPRQQLPARRPA